MAIAFNKTKGGAQKSSISSFAYRDGDNKVRLVGDILAIFFLSIFAFDLKMETEIPETNFSL